MSKFTEYVRESYYELVERVSWPKWNDLQQSTLIVIGATIFITLVVGLMDFIAHNGMKFIYSLFN